MAQLHVELVSAERRLWSGDARMVIAKTSDGEVGVLPQHAPLLGTLVDGGVVRVLNEDRGDLVRAVVNGGFISVAHDRVSILAESAELGDEVDVAAARSAYEQTSGATDEEGQREAARARARLLAAGEEV